MDLSLYYKSRQLGLSGITCDEYLGAGVLRGSDMHKVPSASPRILGVAGAELITPFQKIGQTMDIYPQSAGDLARPVGLPSDCGIGAGKTAQVVPQFDSQQ